MNIFDRQAWYAKIEVSSSLADPHESQIVLSDFLKYALPRIELVPAPDAGGIVLPEGRQGKAVMTSATTAPPPPKSSRPNFVFLSIAIIALAAIGLGICQPR